MQHARNQPNATKSEQKLTKNTEKEAEQPLRGRARERI